jgi:hypothetical protein
MYFIFLIDRYLSGVGRKSSTRSKLSQEKEDLDNEEENDV